MEKSDGKLTGENGATGVDSRCRGAESARPPPPPPPLDGRAAFACAAPAPPLETLEGEGENEDSFRT